MKIAVINAEFTELPGNNQLQAQGEASTIRAAISRAVAALFKQPALKGKRISVVNMTVTLTNKTEEPTLVEDIFES